MLSKTVITRRNWESCRVRRVSRAAFTLIELLLVITIIIILTALVTPAMDSLLRPLQLTKGAQLLDGQLSLARQIALTRNHSVEVRFYQFGDPEIPGEQPSNPGTGRYRAMQIFEVQESGTAVALDKVQRIPPAVVIDSGAALSSIIGSAQASPGIPTATDGAVLNIPLPQVGMHYKAVSFRFLPSGSTNLPSTSGAPWFLTLHNLSDGDPSTKTPPANFFTLQIDANNGHIKTFRP